jgi:hypothetical protein
VHNGAEGSERVLLLEKSRSDLSSEGNEERFFLEHLGNEVELLLLLLFLLLFLLHQGLLLLDFLLRLLLLFGKFAFHRYNLI